MKHIQTGKSRSDAKRCWMVMVDDEDYKYLNQFYWTSDEYRTVTSSLGKTGKRFILARFLLNPPDDIEIDHIDGNRLNNQRSNLRFATSSQNKANRGPRKDNTSGYKGVSWHKQRNKWTARIKANDKYQYLGLFSNKIDAAKAYNKAAIKYFGDYAWLNPL
jgi:hypothetical protein